MDNPRLDQVQVVNQLWKHYQIELSATGVRNVWLRENMQIIGLRLYEKGFDVSPAILLVWANTSHWPNIETGVQ